LGQPSDHLNAHLVRLGAGLRLCRFLIVASRGELLLDHIEKTLLDLAIVLSIPAAHGKHEAEYDVTVAWS
jgi:hypothetical protein